jgi:hypothetical protein
MMALRRQPAVLGACLLLVRVDQVQVVPALPNIIRGEAERTMLAAPRCLLLLLGGHRRV